MSAKQSDVYTVTIIIKDGGQPVDLSAFQEAKWYLNDGAGAEVVITGAIVSPQTGTNKGKATFTFSSSDLASAKIYNDEIVCRKTDDSLRRTTKTNTFVVEKKARN